MPKTPKSLNKKTTGTRPTSTASAADAQLGFLAFENTAQANIIAIQSSGKINAANAAGLKLLGYSKKELLTKKRSVIFGMTEAAIKRMLQKNAAHGHSKIVLPVIKKSGRSFYAEITVATFMDETGMEKCILTINDMSQYIRDQKNIDILKDKTVAENIMRAKSKQQVIDVANKKRVESNIVLATSRQNKIDVKKEKVVAQNIMLAKSKQTKLDVKKEKLVASNIDIAKSKQIKIDVKNKKQVVKNIALALKKSNNRLAENNKWLKHIGKTSYDVMWDWDLKSEKIYVGQSIREVFGYKLKNNIMRVADFWNCIVDVEKEPVEEKLKIAVSSGKKIWSDSFMFKRRDGSIATTICRSTIVRNDEGRAIRLIGAIQDISRLQELEGKLHEQKIIEKAQGEFFLLATKLSFDVIWDWNLLTNEGFMSEGFEELSGSSIKNNKGDMIALWAENIHPDDKDDILKDLYGTIASAATEWEHAYRIRRADGSIAKVYARASIMRSTGGEAYRMIGAMRDLSSQKDLEEKLDHEIKLKEKQITEATEDAKEMERSNIGKELHDNINQLLGASRMYLEMAKKGGNNSTMYLSRSSEYTLTAIEEIRKLSKGLTTDIIKKLGLVPAIEILADDMMEAGAIKISLTTKNFSEKNSDNRFKLNLYRIVQEHLNNILKHAEATYVTIKLFENKKLLQLNIKDDGVGFDTRKQQTGIGLANIISRAEAYKGKADFVSQPGEGCSLSVIFTFKAPLAERD